MFPFLYGYTNLIIFATRVFLGTVFLLHGLPKIKDLNQTAQNFEGMGFKPGNLWGPFIAVLEVAGGTALILGFLTELFSALFAVEMIVTTTWRIKSGNKFVNGYEFDLALLLIALMLLVSGPGSYSLDNLVQLPF